MKAKPKFLRASFILAVLACALTHHPTAPTSAAQTEGRGLSIKAEDGKEVRLYERSYALVVGVSDYAQGWPKLPGVKQDIEEVARALERHGFMVTKVENPDSAQLDKAFKTFIDAHGLGVENRLLFYFAGHGHTIRQSYGDEMGYIVPADAPNPTRDQAGFMSKAMDMQQMELYARRIQSKHALFLFDSCFSGALFALSRAVPDIISYKTARPVRQFITSGSADEQVPDQSIFRRQFVEALEGEADGNKDGYVTGTELGEFLQDKVVNYSRNAQHPQYGKIRNPNLDKGDFVFALPKKAAPPSAVAAKPNVDEPASPAPARVDPAALDLAFWTSIQNSTDAEDYKAYLEKFPNGTYATLARRRAQQYAAAPSGNSTAGPGTVATPPTPTAGWIEKILDSDVDFGSVTKIEINEKFPSATGVKAALMRAGAPARLIDSFGESESPPRMWVISVGSMIDVRAAQAIIAACLKNTDELWSVNVMKEDGNFGNRRRVYVGGFDNSRTRTPRLSRQELLMLLEPGLTAERLHAMLPEK